MFDDASFFDLLGEGAQLLKGLDEESPGFFDDLARLRDILALMGGEKPYAQTVSIDISSAEAAKKSLSDYVGGGIKALPEYMRGFEVAMAVEIIGTAESYKMAAAMAKSAGEKVPARFGKEAVAVYEGYKAKGLHVSGEKVADITSAQAAIDAILQDRTGYEKAPEYIAIQNEAEELYKVMQSEKDENAYQAARKRWDENSERQTSFFAKVRDEQNRALEAEKDIVKSIGREIIDTLLKKSPITEQQAKDWAAKQEITKQAEGRLKRSGYPLAAVRADMAEFYRITGGKASAVILDSEGGRRANASGHTRADADKVINMGANFRRVTLWHEMAHHLESDKMAFAAASGFLASRRESEKLYSLKGLTGWRYRPDEKAFADHFINPYIGKVYDHPTTEVFAMGVQYLSDPYEAAVMAQKDPDMFKMITGYLASPLTPVAKAKLEAHVNLSASRANSTGELKAAYQAAIKKLAASVTFVEGGEIPESNTVIRLSMYPHHKYLGVAKTKDGTLFYLVSGTGRIPQTGRQGKCIYFVMEEETAFRGLSRSLDEVLAMIGMYSLNGLMDTAYRSFYGKQDAGSMKNIVMASEKVQ